MTGAELYEIVGKLLLGFQMDQTLFYQLLAKAQWMREKQRPWVILRVENSSNSVSPAQNTYANSLYLTSFSLPADFLNFYSPNRSMVLVAGDGITFRWYSQIPPERKHEYKDDDTKFYVDIANSKFYLCGNVDQQYAIHLFYVKGTTAIAAGTSWVFPSAITPILAYDVARDYKMNFDYDIVNSEQGVMIEKGAEAIYKQMAEWDDSLQEQSVEGADYPSGNQTSRFINKQVGDNDYFSS